MKNWMFSEYMKDRLVEIYKENKKKNEYLSVLLREAFKTSRRKRIKGEAKNKKIHPEHYISKVVISIRH